MDGYSWGGSESIWVTKGKLLAKHSCYGAGGGVTEQFRAPAHPE